MGEVLPFNKDKKTTLILKDNVVTVAGRANARHPNFEERMTRIRASLEKINTLMKQQKERLNEE